MTDIKIAVFRSKVDSAQWNYTLCRDGKVIAGNIGYASQRAAMDAAMEHELRIIEKQ